MAAAAEVGPEVRYGRWPTAKQWRCRVVSCRVEYSNYTLVMSSPANGLCHRSFHSNFTSKPFLQGLVISAEPLPQLHQAQSQNIESHRRWCKERGESCFAVWSLR